jgi:hypothetical protein
MQKLVKRFSITDTTVQTARTAEEDPLAPWRALAGADDFPAKWQAFARQLMDEARQREEHNRQQFLPYADFSTGQDHGWRRDGHGLRAGPGRAGDFALHPQGDALVQAILPAGWFTHSLSAKLNGTLQSPVLESRPRQRISFLVRGSHGSAVRLVANNCQLAYVHARYLDSDEPHWVTIKVPENPAGLRVYAELMTLFDNPKFPDSAAGLAGDPILNVKLPWEEAIKKFERSYFGVSRVVLHDGPEVPRPELRHLLPLFQEARPARLADWAARHGEIVTAAVQAWADDRAGDDEARWLDFLVQHGLLSNRLDCTPRLQELARAYRAEEQGLARPRTIPGLADWGKGFEQPLFARGDCTRPGEPVPRGFLEVLSPAKDSFRGSGSGWLELAERLASADNPLTARVLVNRVWHHLFGTGIVATVDDFGRYGEQPTPADVQLLDHLATRFVKEGWSIKRLIRAVVLTHTFRLGHQAAPAVLDLTKETEETKKLYGLDSSVASKRQYALQCLRARRLIEAGVRFVEIGSPPSANGVWDQHGKLKEGHEKNALDVDQPIAGLFQDLKRRGLLNETLVVWASEFGRTPHTAGSGAKAGRDHHPEGFTVWLAGGGVKGGTAYGATDELGMRAVENIVSMHDLHATLLHALGLDHERLTYRSGGRDFRLTDTLGGARPITAILEQS